MPTYVEYQNQPLFVSARLYCSLLYLSSASTPLHCEQQDGVGSVGASVLRPPCFICFFLELLPGSEEEDRKLGSKEKPNNQSNGEGLSHSCHKL